jgi:Trm5-related predicted tRNA methylase
VALTSSSTTLLSPFGVPSTEHKPLARRVRDLSQHAVTIVDNGKPGSRHLLSGVQAGLKDLGVARFNIRPKDVASRPHQNFAAVADEAEVLVLALGDCGSCTSGSILDSAHFEAEGVPTVTIVSELFKVVSQKEAATCGLPDMPIVVVPHPVATHSAEELEQLGREISTQVAAGLTEA